MQDQELNLSILWQKKFELFEQTYGEYVDGDNAVEGWIRKFYLEQLKL